MNFLGEEGDAKTAQAVGVTDVKKELSIIAPKNDKRVYSVDVCENGVEVVLINDPDERNITLKAIIGWGNGYGKSSTCQFEEFLRIRERRTRDASDGRRYVSYPWINKESTHFESTIRRNRFKSDIAQFFEFFNIKKEIESSDADVSRILDRILDDDEVSFEDLNIFFKEVFLRSKITLLAYGNIKKEEAEQICQGAALIRSKQERVVSAKELKARRLHFVNSAKSLDNCYYGVPRGYGIKMTFMPYESSPFQKNSTEAIAKIVKNKIEDKFLEYIETTYPNVDYGINFGDLKYSNGLASAEFGFYMTQPENDAPFDEEIHENILETLFSYLGEVRVSEDDYKKFTESMKEKFESEVHVYGSWKILGTMSEASTLQLPVENYLNHPYKFKDLKSDEISRILQSLSNIENWYIAVLGGYSRRLSEEAVSRIKDKINQVSENPSTSQGIRD